MAIIRCIVCSKRISNKAETCMHCGAIMKGSSEEQLERAAHLQKLKKNRRIQSFSFLAILAFVLGFFLYYFKPSDGIWRQVSIYLLAIGFIGYIVSRAWILYNKKK
ncbi:MAG: hypothetical protein HWD86_03705 [Kangiellaceae bacterium]|nr:hypothetical protein [Kangiellaceae bacterium]